MSDVVNFDLVVRLDRVPAMRQQLADLAGALHGQTCHHIAQIGVGVMPVHAR